MGVALGATPVTQTWREKAAPIIAKVLREAEAKSWDEKQIRTTLKNAYPFGERRYYPYAAWLDEIKRQRGKKRTPRSAAERRELEAAKSQLRLVLPDLRIERAAGVLLDAIDGRDKPMLPSEIKALQRAIGKVGR